MNKELTPQEEQLQEASSEATTANSLPLTEALPNQQTEISNEPSTVDGKPTTEQPVAETAITNPKSKIETMEVHHHPQLHHKEKPWKEYLLECLMIFIAVSMGFIAENIREGIVHREKEKQQIESFVNALHSDSVQLAFVIKMNDTIINSLNKFTSLRKRTSIDDDYVKQFYESSAIGLCVDVYFKPNDAAFQEMKASGIIGALKHRNIVDSIFKYQQNNNIIQMQEADCYFLFKEGFSLLGKSIDFNDYTDTSHVHFTLGEQNVFFIRFDDVNGLSIPDDKRALKSLFSLGGGLAVADLSYITLLKDQLEYNKRLTVLLRKEYHLEHE